MERGCIWAVPKTHIQNSRFTYLHITIARSWITAIEGRCYFGQIWQRLQGSVPQHRDKSFVRNTGYEECYINFKRPCKIISYCKRDFFILSTESPWTTKTQWQVTLLTAILYIFSTTCMPKPKANIVLLNTGVGQKSKILDGWYSRTNECVRCSFRAKATDNIQHIITYVLGKSAIPRSVCKEKVLWASNIE